MQKKLDKIVVRVYALIIEGNRILLSDEFWYDTPMTKFPGGGLEPGEGIVDCLKREILEELGVEPVQMEHLFTCDSLITSDFIASTQVIPIYYKVKLPAHAKLQTSEFRYDFKKLENGAISHRWIDLDLLNESELTFSGDRMALQILTKSLTLRPMLKTE